MINNINIVILIKYYPVLLLVVPHHSLGLQKKIGVKWLCMVVINKVVCVART